MLLFCRITCEGVPRKYLCFFGVLLLTKRPVVKIAEVLPSLTAQATPEKSMLKF